MFSKASLSIKLSMLSTNILLRICGLSASTSQLFDQCSEMKPFDLGSVVFAGFGGGLYDLICSLVNAIGTISKSMFQ